MHNNDMPLPHLPADMALWLWYRSQEGMLPYSGGLLEQPAYVIEDFRYLDKLQRLHELPYDIEEASKRLQEIVKKAALG